MLVVVFQVEFNHGRSDDYLALAAALKQDLERFDGFISVERFESLSTPGKIVSVSYWRDADSIDRWREWQAHREAQAAGKQGIFSDYRITVAQVVRDYSAAR